MTNRRNFLKIAGGGIILAAGGAGAFLGTRTPTSALAPWQAAGSYADPRMQALSYAILAPNPHNRQPWLVDLSVANQIAIWRDKERNLPETDPFDRQLTIGMGCFLEQMTIAASATGHKVETRLFPRGESGPVAIATLSDGAETDPLFAHVLNRRSCKEPYSAERPDVPQDILEIADVHVDPGMVDTLRNLTWEAWLVETSNHAKLKESTDLFRLGKREVEANPDGIDFSGPFFETAILLGLMSREGTLDPDSFESREAKRIYHETFMATPAFAVIRTPTNTRAAQIDAGRRWLRLNLMTTAAGLALHPVSQALQEYDEMQAHYKAAHSLLAEPGETVQMLGRLGYGPMTPVSPRWPIEAKVIDA